jgi:hypothetical protein
MPKPSPESVKIVKVGGEVPTPKPTPEPAKPTSGGRKKSMRTFPRGILKKHTIKAVRDPAKAPPLKKTKGTLRILTEKGVHLRRQNIKKTIRNMPDAKVRETLKKAGMPISSRTPPDLAKEILEGGMEAGMIVVK